MSSSADGGDGGSQTPTAVGRARHRQGTALVRRGIPYADPAGTLSLLPGAAIGEWLADVRGAFTGRLLDAGAGNQPYRLWYETLVDGVVSLDATPAPGLSALGLADHLPFAPDSFDTVLSTQVWEHVEDPATAAAEAWRVLRPGGRLVVTVPFLYPTHEAPYDFVRFTRFGLESVLRRAGFQVERIDAEGGPALLLSHMLVLGLSQALDASGRRLGLMRPPTEHPALRRLFTGPMGLAINARYRLRGARRGVPAGAGRATLGYFAVARKPLL